MAADNARLVAILAYVTLIGWVVALFLHQGDRSALGTFHLRQALGLYVVGALVSFVPAIGWLLSLVAFVFWLLGLIAAIQGERRPTPWIGEYFQQYLGFVR
jgi:uncharacterized membrane protein